MRVRARVRENEPPRMRERERERGYSLFRGNEPARARFRARSACLSAKRTIVTFTPCDVRETSDRAIRARREKRRGHPPRARASLCRMRAWRINRVAYLADSGCFFARIREGGREGGKLTAMGETERNAGSYRRNENSRIHESRDL